MKEPPAEFVHLIVTAKRQEQRHGNNNGRCIPMDLGLEMHKGYLRTVKGIGLPSPSTAAKSSQYAKLQANPETTIYDGFYNINRPANTSALPIEVQSSRGIVEPSLAKSLRSTLTNILGKYTGQAVVGDAIANGIIRKAGKRCSIPLLVIEYERALGGGGCDPMTRGSHSALSDWRDEDLKEIRDKCCCPTFIITGGGPYLAVLGVILTDKFVVQRLTNLEWLGMGRAFEVEHLYRVAQVFGSLREALRRLDEFYDKLEGQDLKLVHGMPHPRFYPHYTTFTDFASKSVEEFEYLRPLTSSNKSPFLVKLKLSGGRAAVKFVARYGADAHQLLAAVGMAPRLLFCGPIDSQDDIRETLMASAEGTFGLHLGPLCMVVMDYVEGKDGEDPELGNRPGDTHEQVKAAIEKLHASDFVFGDLRSPNIVFSGSKAVLVDFDWAGKRGEAFYPTELGEGITKYCEGRDLAIIEKEHDLALLNHYFSQTQSVTCTGLEPLYGR